MAKQYLSEIGDTGEASEEEEEDNGLSVEDRTDMMGGKLKRARLEATGGYRRQIADSLAGQDAPDPSQYRWMKGHTLPLTCVALSPDDRHAFTGSKDNAIIQYDVETGARIGYLRRAWAPGSSEKAIAGEILALAASSDGRVLASGGRDKMVRLYDLRKLQQEGGCDPVKTEGGNRSCTSTSGRGTRGFGLRSFSGHLDSVTGLAFQLGAAAQTLFSCSMDRTVKLWNIRDMGFMDTLYGHQSEVLGIDSLRREVAVSGGRDRSARQWKWSEDKQLVFRGSSSCTSLECVRMLNDNTFVTGDDNGYVSIWSHMKKKPTMSVDATCGDSEAEEAETAPGVRAPRKWVSSLASVRSADLVASGSNDGFVKLWKATTSPKRHLALVSQLEVKGFVNAMEFASDGRFLVCATGQESRLGRWERQKEGKNALALIKLDVSSVAQDEEE